MQVDVHFESGREVLNAYWGYLSGGGLTIEPETSTSLHKGQHVALQVHIGARRCFSVNGRVARTGHGGTIIAFDTDESQNQLLSAALSEQPIDLEAHLSLCDTSQRALVPARLFEISEDGCCLRLRAEHGALFNVGAEVVIEAPGFRINGCVVSANERDRCVIFGLADDDAVQAIRTCLHAIQSS